MISVWSILKRFDLGFLIHNLLIVYVDLSIFQKGKPEVPFQSNKAEPFRGNDRVILANKGTSPPAQSQPPPPPG